MAPLSLPKSKDRLMTHERCQPQRLTLGNLHDPWPAKLNNKQILTINNKILD